MQEKLKQFELFLTRAPGAVAYKKLQGKDLVFEYANQKYLDLVQQDSVIGKSILQIFPDLPNRNPEVWQAMNDVANSGGSFSRLVEAELDWNKTGKPYIKDVELTYEGVVAGDGSPLGVITYATDVTALVQQRKLAADSEQKNQQLAALLDSLFNNAPSFMSVIAGPEFIFERANPLYLNFIGNRDIIGKPLAVALPEMNFQRYLDILNQVRKTKEPFVGQELVVKLYQNNSAELSDVYVTFIFQPDLHSDRIFIYGQDVTSHVVARKRLEESEAAIRAYTESMPTMAFIADADGNINYYNQRWMDFTGLTREEAYGWEWKPVIHERHMKQTVERWSHSVKTGAPYEIEYLVRNKQGQYRWLLGRAMPAKNSDGKIVAWYGTNTDIHEQKMNELELQDAKNDAERANQLKTAFLANMSHEIRTPLGAMMGFADLLRDHNLRSEERNDYLETMIRNGEQLAVIINDILDISKVESGHLTLEFIQTEPAAIVTDVFSSLSVKAKAKQIELLIAIDPTAPKKFATDPTRLKQILMNLVGNSLKFTESGSVSVRIYSESDSSLKSVLCLEVSDTGIGVSADHAERIFEMFVQADDTTTRKYGGTGLGLALSRKLAKALGGDLQLVRSELGKGSTFVVKVRNEMDRITPRLTQAPTVEASVEPAKSIEGLNILVVDDAPDNQKLISRYLTKFGAKVQVASNGSEGIDQALSTKFDIVLMDIQMPVLDGYTATQKLRELGYDVPIIALTAHAMSEVRQSVLLAGMSGHLTKPIDPQELLSSISKLAAKPRDHIN